MMSHDRISIVYGKPSFVSQEQADSQRAECQGSSDMMREYRGLKIRSEGRSGDMLWLS